MTTTTAKAKWLHGILAQGDEFGEFWREYLQGGQRRIALVLASGFDPRATHFLESVSPHIGNQLVAALKLRFAYRSDPEHLETLAEENSSAIDEYLSIAASHIEAELPMANPEHVGEGARHAHRAMKKFLEDADATDVIIDINAMPLSVAMTMVLAALRHCESTAADEPPVNLHVVVSHDPHRDHAIRGIDPDQEAGQVSGFRKPIEGAAPEMPGVWLAILGTKHEPQMQSIAKADWVPDYICPVVPNPSRIPRQDDDLLVEYRDFLIALNEEDGRVPRNILRVSESDPFEAYQELLDTMRQHHASYRQLGGCKVLLSAHSTKLLSLAGLMALYDAERLGYADAVGFAFVESRSHSYDPEEGGSDPSFYSLWLAGDPYE